LPAAWLDAVENRRSRMPHNRRFAVAPHDSVQLRKRYTLKSGAVAKGKKTKGVIRVFEVRITIVAAGVGSDQLVVIINAEPIGKGFKRQSPRGITARHRIAISIKPDTEAVVGTHGVGDSGVCWMRW
jgi:hypothetical protein